MPGRPRNDDRRAIEAFARIHQGAAGAAGSSPLRNVPTSPDASRFVPGPGPAEPFANGYSALPVLPNLERPRIGRRVGLAVIATAIVLAGFLGLAGATGAKHRGSAKSAAGSVAPAPGSPTGRRSAPATTTTAGNGPVSPTSSSPTGVSFVLPVSEGPLTVTIAATGGPCWAEVGAMSGGAISWAGTIVQGQQHVLSAGPRWWLRLGAPEYVTVTVNGRQLGLPVTSQPLNLSITTA